MKALPAAGREKRASVLRLMHVFIDTCVLVLKQGQDDSCIRLIIFFYSFRYRHIVKHRFKYEPMGVEAR